MDAPTSITTTTTKPDTDCPGTVLPAAAPPSSSEKPPYTSGRDEDNDDHHLDDSSLSPKERRYRSLRMKSERLRHFLQHGRSPPGLTKLETRNLKNQAKVHILDRVNQALYYTGGKAGVKKRLVVDANEVEDIIRHYHSNQMGGHSGINGTLAKITQYYTWHGMKEDVTRYISTCALCQSNEKVTSKTKPALAKMLKFKVTQSLEVVGMDLIGPLPASVDNYKYVLACTDCYSKFVDLFALKSKEAWDIAQCIKAFLCRWGVPKRLLLSKEPEFVSQLNAAVSEVLNVSQPVVSSSDHPLTDCPGEQADPGLSAPLNRLVSEHQDTWPHRLQELAGALRTQVQPATGTSPFFLMFGRQPRTADEMLPAEELMHAPTVDEAHIAEMVDMNTRVRADLERSRQTALEQYTDNFRSQSTGTCLDSAFQILQTSAEFDCLKYRTESTEDNEYLVITRTGTFASVGLPMDLASLTLDRHGRLTFQAVYRQAVEHRLFDGEAFDAPQFSQQLRRLARLRFCRGVPLGHVGPGEAETARCVKTLGYPALRYQADKCQVFYELGQREDGGRSSSSAAPYRCVSCKYASKFLLKRLKKLPPPPPPPPLPATSTRKELKRLAPAPDFYAPPGLASRGTGEWTDGAKGKCRPQQQQQQQQQQSSNSRGGHLGQHVRPPQPPQPSSLAVATPTDCQDLREIVQAINSECNVDLSEVVFNASSSVNSM